MTGEQPALIDFDDNAPPNALAQLYRQHGYAIGHVCGECDHRSQHLSVAMCFCAGPQEYNWRATWRACGLWAQRDDG